MQWSFGTCSSDPALESRVEYLRFLPGITLSAVSRLPEFLS